MAKKGTRKISKKYTYLALGAVVGIVALCVAIPSVKTAVMNKINTKSTTTLPTLED